MPVPKPWMIKTGNSKITAENLIATNRGWELQHPDGTMELIQCYGGLSGGIVAPQIIGFFNPLASYVVGDDVYFTMSFNEKVVVVGTPQIAFTVGGVAVLAVYDALADENDDNTMAFKYESTALGVLADVVAIALNGGTIKDVDANAVTLTLPADYVQPVSTIAAISPVAFTNPAGEKTVGDDITFTITYNRDVVVAETPQITFKIGETACAADFVSNVANVLTFTHVSAVAGAVNTVASTIDLNTTGTIKDSFTNDANLVIGGYTQPVCTVVAA